VAQAPLNRPTPVTGRPPKAALLRSESSAEALFCVEFSRRDVKFKARAGETSKKVAA